LATTFLVSLNTPLSGVGTYSYVVGPNIRDGIRTNNIAFAGIPATGANTNLRLPPSGTGGSTSPGVFPPPANADTTVSTINVSGFSAALNDVNVNLKINYPFSGDLEIRLVAPNGQSVLLATNEPSFAGGGNFYQNTTFDDQSPNSFNTFPANTPYTTIKPDGAGGLSIFNGMPAAQVNGAWQLQVRDDFAGDTGTLIGWSLILNGGTLQVVQSPGNLMDQDQNAFTGDTVFDTFAVPKPVNGIPFQLPYVGDTLPLIIPGPHVITTGVPNNSLSADNLVLNGTNNAVDVHLRPGHQPVELHDREHFCGSSVPSDPLPRTCRDRRVTFTGGGGSGAAGIATISGGQVIGVAITNPGSGYTSAPNVVFTGGGGSLAAGTAQVTGGFVTGVTITNPGKLYTSSVPQAIPDGGSLDAFLTVPDALSINALAVGVSISHPQVSELTAVLIARTGPRSSCSAACRGRT